MIETLDTGGGVFLSGYYFTSACESGECVRNIDTISSLTDNSDSTETCYINNHYPKLNVSTLLLYILSITIGVLVIRAYSWYVSYVLVN